MPARASRLLAVNGGSSSLKLALFDLDAETTPIAREEIDGRAIEAVRWLHAHARGRRTTAVAHRLVHGGDAFDRAIVITPTVRKQLDELVPLAPNHLPGELALVDDLVRALPDAVHVACFDTAFHRALPDLAHTLPLPGVRRFGFHGLSYTFLMSELERLAGPQAARGRVILAHLGSGASLAAVKDGRPVDTSMGLTPTGGLLMSTRAGDVDPGAVVHVMRRDRLSADEMDVLLTKHSGLAAISGGTGDMRTLLAHEADDTRARLAVDIFCYHTAKWIGAFAAALGGLDTLVFSAGIGERSPEIRRRVLARLEFLGACCDAEANARNAGVISTMSSAVSIRVIPTDEAVVMARQARDVLNSSQASSDSPEAHS